MDLQAKPRQKQNWMTNVYRSILNNLASAFREPITLLLMVIAGAMAVAKAKYPNADIIFTVTKPLADMESTKELAQWIRSKGGKIVGAAILAPSLWSLPKGWFLWVTIPVLGYLFVTPTIDVYTLIFTALSIRLFFKTDNAYAKTFVVILVSLAFFWFDSLKTNYGTYNLKLDDSNTTVSVNKRSLDCHSFYDEERDLACCRYPWISCDDNHLKEFGSVQRLCQNMCWLSGVLPLERCLEKCIPHLSVHNSTNI